MRIEKSRKEGILGAADGGESAGDESATEKMNRKNKIHSESAAKNELSR